MATPIDYDEGSNRPLRIYTPTLDPTGPNMVGTCGGACIGLSSGVLDNASYYSGMGKQSSWALWAGFNIPRIAIGDAVFPGVAYMLYNPATEFLPNWLSQWQTADQVATPGQLVKSVGWSSVYNVTSETAQIGDSAWGTSPLS